MRNIKLSKQKVVNCYHFICNLFFRRNNLLSLLIKAKIFNQNRVKIGKGSVIRDCEFICKSGNSIYIGDNVKLFGLRIYMNSKGNLLVIGDGTIVNADKYQRTFFNVCGGSKIEIGSDCLFSNSIEIHTTDYHKILKDGVLQNAVEPVVIGDHCWIGLQSLILKGVVLKDNVVVGARSLVTKSFDESKIIIAGIPARIVKRGITWNR